LRRLKDARRRRRESNTHVYSLDVVPNTEEQGRGDVQSRNGGESQDFRAHFQEIVSDQ
jgi:hypothetical protein